MVALVLGWDLGKPRVERRDDKGGYVTPKFDEMDPIDKHMIQHMFHTGGRKHWLDTSVFQTIKFGFP